LSAELLEKIQRLRQQRKAVILAHNYQPGEVQDIADFVGDSLGLSREAAQTDAETIVFCGVHFMAETAAILSPEKTILLPEKHAGCPMADMITAEQLQQLKDKHPDALVVSYVNTTAEVKALSDYCCTSGNAIELVSSLPPDRQIIFAPDKYLGQHVIDRTGRDMILWPGYCPTHVIISADDIEKAKQEHPDAVVMAHPECTEDVRARADELLSTSGMLNFATKSDAKGFIVATETGIIYTLKKQNPEKEFFSATENAICPNMKKITLEKVAWALEDMEYKITVPEDISSKAQAALDRMLAVLPTK
jgi:quinolinate synthase